MRRLFVLIFACAALTVACGPAGQGDDNPDGVDAGIPDLPDADGDGIADEHEGRATNVDTDGDGIPDYLDEDSDNDGIPDYREGGDNLTGTPPLDSDGDTVPDFRDTDSDNNGRDDGLDGVDDIDGDGIGNFADLDDDGDGINDVIEIGPSPAMPIDSDGDGLPDYHDTDSDNDTILDQHEGISDFDMDNKPAYVDNDSDGDCIIDMMEAGDTDVNTPPVDTDGDGQFDFLDLDSDNDGLLDNLEDPNCNGVRDGSESDRTKEDTDGDGVSDLIENAAGTDPNNGADNPQANGDFVFIVPYMAAPSPTEDTLDFSTDISQADVIFAMDETGSMSAQINNLRSSMSSLVGTVRGQIPNTGFGVVGYRDFPTSPFGGGGDYPFKLHHRVMTTNTGAGLTSVQNRVNGYSAAGGGDGPEANWQMLYQVATGAALNSGGSNIGAFNPATAFPAAPPAGEEVGTIGGVGIRVGSLPIVVWIADACGHNSPTSGSNYSFAAATRASAEAALLAKGIRVIALIASSGACSGDLERTDALHGVNATNTIVPPSAWGPAGARPGSCAVGSCCTGLNGAGEAAVGGLCPLLFRVNGSTGAGLTTAVADAIRVLTTFVELDIGAVAQDDPADLVDAVASFVQRVETNTVTGAPCTAGLTVIDTNADTINDTFPGVNPGTTVCFDVIPKSNTTVPALTTPQMFKATIVVSGDNITTLDTRDIFFLVPPEIPDVPID